MKKTTLLLALLALPGALLAQAPAAPEKMADAAPAAEAAAPAGVSVGLAADKNEVVKPETAFTIDGDTKIYAGARVTGAAGDYTLSFKKGDKVAYEKKIAVPSTPYRVWTWKTFRKGDAGDWTAVLTGPGGAVGSTGFKVDVK
jgi:hypothetical protein